MSNTIKISKNSTVPEWSIFTPKKSYSPNVMYYMEDENGMYAYAIVSTDTIHKVGTFIDYFEVKKDYMRRGIGTRLLNEIISIHKNVYLSSPYNSCKFYLKLGAKPFASHSHCWILGFTERFPIENWKLWGGEGFCSKPVDNFKYDEKEWLEIQ